MRRIVAGHDCSRRIHIAFTSALLASLLLSRRRWNYLLRFAVICYSMEVYMLLKKILGFAALGALLVVAAPAHQAQAATPVSPGIAATAQGDAGKLTTNVQWGHHHHHNHWRSH